MAYTLEQARTTLKARLTWFTQPVESTPLVGGLFDGANRVFRLPVAPMNPNGSIVFHDTSGGLVTHVAVSNSDTGAVLFDAGHAPTNIVYATYTAQMMPDAVLLEICKAGFEEMESRYNRGFYLTAQNAQTFISGSDVQVVDPVCGSRKFSTSQPQISFLLACAEYRLLRELTRQASLNALSYREERIGGLQVDTVKRASSLAALLEQTAKDLDAKEAAARVESGDSESEAAFITNELTVWPQYGENGLF